MSKNVAVFVDVANIFYAAKAAGVDIDYTTLLKTATAGRDFVRAYAYTGLDPENDNQRQFHSFLARSGYKVVSKDIRKYGDGKVKANLDIELVVDMMRTAQNLDIAVVVSGDGDFAPAIRAVQQMGVRVEVISFRGNTSSDLIEVADTFIDITQIAKVEKGSSRSGRRVAAEDDLSMTEVPDKESEGAPRRGRGGRGRGRTPSARTPRPPPRQSRRRRVAAARRLPAPIWSCCQARSYPRSLPRRSRPRTSSSTMPIVDAEAVERMATDDADAVDATEVARSDADGEVDGEGHRRRRRRRGGRGRGRGRGQDREVPTEAGAPGVASAAGSTDDEDEEDEELDAYPAPRAPQASTFGSVWDSQIGVPSAPLASADLGGPTADDEDEDEPEIPEYLLAERRQRAGRPGGRPAQPGRGRGGRPGVAVAPISRPSIVSDMDDRVAAPSAATAATATLPRGPIAGLDRTADLGTAAARRGQIAGHVPIGRRRAHRQRRRQEIPGARSRQSWRRCCAPSSPARVRLPVAPRRPRRPLALTPRPKSRASTRRQLPRPRRRSHVTEVASALRRGPSRSDARLPGRRPRPRPGQRVSARLRRRRGQAEAHARTRKTARRRPPQQRSDEPAAKPTRGASRSAARAHAKPPRRPIRGRLPDARSMPAALDRRRSGRSFRNVRRTPAASRAPSVSARQRWGSTWRLACCAWPTTRPRGHVASAWRVGRSTTGTIPTFTVSTGRCRWADRLGQG